MSDIQELKKKRDRLKRITVLKKELPHLYGFPLYKWQEEFWNCDKTFQFIFKANQIGGSSIMIKRCIHYATEDSLWVRFVRPPKMIMYLYPDKNTATREWETKWTEFMPNGAMKDDPKYGWKETWDGKYIDSITFNTGIILYFKTYGSGAENLQASTPAILACDEELPEALWPELQTRVSGSPANKGAMYWQGCTPTTGQKYLAKIQSGETVIPDSWVKTVSQYDCLYYANGDKSLWTLEHIKMNEQRLPSQREIDVRIHGLFKPIDKLAITQFRREKHVIPWHLIKGWEIYCGIDYGVGGATGHPSTIVFIAVSSDYGSARSLRAWKGPHGGGSESTTPDDVIVQYLDMLKELGIEATTATYYDPAAASIGVISERSGLGFLKANKDREHGFNTLNSLFKNDMLKLMDKGDDDTVNLIDEIETVTTDFDKKRAGDDLVDALRYATSSIPFNFSNIKLTEPEKSQPTSRVGRHEVNKEYEFDELGDEIDEWNDYYG